MAKIFHGGPFKFSQNDYSDAEKFATAYWGDLAFEKYFPIAFWKVKQMLAASNSNQIALRVTDIDNPAYVNAAWIVFEESMADTLADPVEKNVYYFILDDKLFNGPFLVSTPTGLEEIKGLWKVNNSPENNLIRGRIGFDTVSNQFFAFFQAAECKIIGMGAGGQGTSTGFKIPSP
jgi:hypothetical protein